MTAKNTTVRLAGELKLAPIKTNAYTEFVNSTTVDLALETEEITVENGRGGGGNDDIDRRVKSLKLSISARRASIDALEIAFGGPSTKVAAGAVASESHTVSALDAEIILDRLVDGAVAVTVTPDGGGTAYVLGEDYERTRLGIRPLAGGAIEADDVIKVAYTGAEHLRIEALMQLSREFAVLFDGKNERTGKPWAAMFHRGSFSPAKNIKWYDGNQFASFDIECEILVADWIDGDMLSRFYKVLVGDAL